MDYDNYLAKYGELLLKKGSGTLFVTLSDPILYSKVVSNKKIELGITDKLRKFLEAVLDQAVTVNMLEQDTSLDGTAVPQSDINLSHYSVGSSKGNIALLVQMLVEKELLIKTSLARPGGGWKRPVLFFPPISQFTSIITEENEHEQDKSKALVEQRALTFHAKKQLSLNFDSALEYENLIAAHMTKSWANILRLLSMSRKKTSLYNASFRAGASVAEFEITAPESVGICKESDARTILHISTICSLAIKTRFALGLPFHNEFLLDIVDLCRLANLDSEGGNRRTMRNSINRMYLTNYKLVVGKEATGKFALNKMGWPESENNFRFLTELDSTFDQHGRGNKTSPRWFRIVIHSKTFSEMVAHAQESSPDVYLWHKELLQHSNGMIHLLYQRLNVLIPRSATNDIVRIFDEEGLQQELAPQSSLSTFRTCFKALFLSLQSKHESNAKISVHDVPDSEWHGDYTIKDLGFEMHFQMVYGLLDTVSFRRDQKDPLTGSNSKHKRLTKERSSGSLVV